MRRGAEAVSRSVRDAARRAMPASGSPPSRVVRFWPAAGGTGNRAPGYGRGRWRSRPQEAEMLTFTETARQMVLSFMAEGYEERPALRVAVRGSPFAPEYDLSLVDDEPGADDVVLDGGGFRVLVDRESASRLEGSTID